MRRRALLSAGKEESPYAFYFNIELKAGEMWTANAEQLVEINKMFEIIFKFTRDSFGDIDGCFDASPEFMPPEFDLRVNGERKYWGFYYCRGYNDDVDVYISFDTSINIWFATVTTNWHNPVLNSFEIFPPS